MSRSVKKVSIFKDSAGKEKKRFASKRFRQKERGAIHHERDCPIYSREITNPYDLCDWKWFVGKDEKNYKRAKRK